MIRLALFATLLVAPQLAHAEEKEEKITKDQVPAPVLDTVAKKYARATLKGFERATDDGKVTYEVAVELGAEKLDVELSPEGRITGEEKRIPPSSLPAAVTSALAFSKYKFWAVTGVERVIKDEKADAPLYEVAVKNGARKSELVFDKGGGLVKATDKK